MIVIESDITIFTTGFTTREQDAVTLAAGASSILQQAAVFDHAVCVCVFDHAVCVLKQLEGAPAQRVR